MESKAFRRSASLLAVRVFDGHSWNPRTQINLPGVILSRYKLPEVTSLAHRIRVAREAAGLKKVDVARETGLSLSYVGRIENGKSHPSRIVVQALGLALGVEPDWLAQGKGEQTSKGGEISRDSYLAQKSAAGELDIERYLLGTPLSGAFSRVPRSIRQKWTTSWQKIPDQRKTDVRRVLATFANAAVVLNQLPAELAEPLHRQFEKQLRAYAATVFDLPSERSSIR